MADEIDVFAWDGDDDEQLALEELQAQQDADEPAFVAMAEAFLVEFAGDPEMMRMVNVIREESAEAAAEEQ